MKRDTRDRIMAYLVVLVAVAVGFIGGHIEGRRNAINAKWECIAVPR